MTPLARGQNFVPTCQQIRTHLSVTAPHGLRYFFIGLPGPGAVRLPRLARADSDPRSSWKFSLIGAANQAGHRGRGERRAIIRGKLNVSSMAAPT